MALSVFSWSGLCVFRLCVLDRVLDQLDSKAGRRTFGANSWPARRLGVIIYLERMKTLLLFSARYRSMAQG